jgi:hypothetical protein
VDHEAGLVAMEPQLNAAGTMLIKAAPGAHVPKVERKIRDIKNSARAIIAQLPYRLPAALIRYLIEYAVSRINLLPSNSYLAPDDARSPRERFYGVKPDYKQHVTIQFGEYCQVYNTNLSRTNDMTERTHGAIALGPSPTTPGSATFWVIHTRRTVTRSKWTVIPITQEIINVINDIANTAFIIPAPDEESDEDDIDVPEVPTLVNTLPAEGPLRDIAIETTAVENTAVETTPVEYVAVDYTDQPTEAVESTAVDSPADQDIHSPQELQPAQDNPPLKEQGTVQIIEPRRNPTRQHNMPSRYMLTIISEIVLHVSIQQALRTIGPSAIKAVEEEVDNLLAYKTFAPVNAKGLSSSDRKNVLPSFTFIKTKYNASGGVDRVRARTTAGGHRQDRALYSAEDTSAPTVAMWCIFLELLLAAHESREVHVIDIKSAYLNASMSRHNVMVKLEPLLTDIILKREPSFSSGIDHDGRLIVKLDKALYGCIQSANLWYQHISETLIKQQFKRSNYDHCTYHLVTADGKRCTVLLYVDDLLITSTSTELVKQLIDALTSTYGPLTHKCGTNFDYLGMNLDYSNPGTVDIGMHGFIEELLAEHWQSKASYKSPATSHLFETRECNKLGVQERESFHSITAKLLYLSKRIRPDLLTAVSFLCTRARSPDEDDQKKLDRVLGYLHHTRDLKLKLSSTGPINLTVYIDASFAVHSDMKGHTGGIVMVGDAPIIAISRKQQRVAKSSTESELIAVSDVISQVIQIRSYLIERGLNVGRATIMQDNQSTMRIIGNGKTTSKSTRHFDIALFFAKDQVDAGQVEFKYCPTADQLADLLTKPLQGAQFFKLRAKLLNLGISDRRGVLEVHDNDPSMHSN